MVTRPKMGCKVLFLDLCPSPAHFFFFIYVHEMLLKTVGLILSAVCFPTHSLLPVELLHVNSCLPDTSTNKILAIKPAEEKLEVSTDALILRLRVCSLTDSYVSSDVRQSGKNNNEMCG